MILKPMFIDISRAGRWVLIALFGEWFDMLWIQIKVNFESLIRFFNKYKIICGFFKY